MIDLNSNSLLGFSAQSDFGPSGANDRLKSFQAHLLEHARGTQRVKRDNPFDTPLKPQDDFGYHQPHHRPGYEYADATQSIERTTQVQDPATAGPASELFKLHNASMQGKFSSINPSTWIFDNFIVPQLFEEHLSPNKQAATLHNHHALMVEGLSTPPIVR